jgi:hypothetical protein
VSEGMVVHKVRYHRNGVSGDPFFSVLFDWDGLPMVATVFDQESCLAVLSLHDPSSTWRGDLFEEELREAIAVADLTGEAYEQASTL